MDSSTAQNRTATASTTGRTHAPHALGRQGEDHAAEWYEARGGRIVDRNWRHGRHGELDLIVALDSTLVICEVKARASNRFGIPAEAVGWDKQRRIRQLAAAWLAANRGWQQVRFDVASVVQGKVDVIEDAF